jgi:hypothetical protein
VLSRVLKKNESPIDTERERGELRSRGVCPPSAARSGRQFARSASETARVPRGEDFRAALSPVAVASSNPPRSPHTSKIFWQRLWCVCALYGRARVRVGTSPNTICSPCCRSLNLGTSPKWVPSSDLIVTAEHAVSRGAKTLELTLT